MLKFHKLFDTVTARNTFLDQIVPTDSQRSALVTAKNLIRDHLRTGIENASVTIFGTNKKVSPRFRTQGSWSYGTCIQCAQHPPQEMDWDFGVYLPVEIWQGSGPPDEIARKYFDVVEALLTSLCKQQEWTLKSGKTTCIRVQISSWAHIDVPLYAAPAFKFVQIFEAAGLRTLSADRAQLFKESAALGDLIEQDWEDLLDDIYLAGRDGKWKKSDPALISRWYADRAREHGDQLTRICRYMKAWRDFTWQSGGPTSIALMIAVTRDFVPRFGRDDLVLEEAANRVAQSLLGEIRESGIDEGAEDFNRLSLEDRVEASRASASLAEAIKSARGLHGSQKVTAIQLLQAKLGDRIPFDLSLVEEEAEADKVRSQPARVVAAPVVLRSQAG